MPRSQAWYGTDWSLDFGDAVTNITVEVLQEADSAMDKRRNELRQKKIEEELELKKQMEMMTIEEKMRLHSMWDK